MEEQSYYAGLRSIGEQSRMEERWKLVRRTPRGSIVSIESKGREKCLIKTTSLEDLRDITRLLDSSGIQWRMFQRESPPYKPMRKRLPRDPNWYIEFDFADLGPVKDFLSPGLLEEGYDVNGR